MKYREWSNRESSRGSRFTGGRRSSSAEMADGGVVLGQPGGARELRSGAKIGGEARA